MVDPADVARFWIPRSIIMPSEGDAAMPYDLTISFNMLFFFRDAAMTIT